MRRANVAAHIGGSVHGPYCTVSREPLEISAGEVLVHTQRELGSWIEAHTQGNAWVFHTLPRRGENPIQQGVTFFSATRILPGFFLLKKMDRGTLAYLWRLSNQ